MKKNKTANKQAKPNFGQHAQAAIAQAVGQLASAPKAETFSGHVAVQLPFPAAEPVAFKMRTECQEDGNLLYEMLWPYLEYWEEEQEKLVSKGKQYPGPGVEIRFGITPHTVTLSDIQSLFHCTPDCHVAEETVAWECDYTGTRKTLPEGALKVPDAALIQPMLNRVEGARDYLRIVSRRAERLSAVLKAVADLGALPEMPRGGLMAVVTHKPTGLVSFRRVSGVESHDEDPVRDRMMLLQASGTGYIQSQAASASAAVLG